MTQNSFSGASKVPSTAMAAVAYQDHLLKEMSLGPLSLVDPVKGKKFSLKQALHRQERHRKHAISHAKSTIDTGLPKKKTEVPKPPVEEEYVLDPQPRPLTLAQKLGLVPCTEDQRQRLSEPEWKELKKASNQREDFSNPCVICKDDFRLEDQVLLSCSHVFHRACLQAFERFTGKKTCPMCRRAGYQTRVVHDGTTQFKHKSAAKIQATWRGHVVRKWYTNLRRTVAPKDPRLRQKFFENKLSEITDRMVAMAGGESVERFLEDIDQSLRESRNVFRHWDKVRMAHMTEDEWLEIAVKASDRGATECPICLRSFSIDVGSLQSNSGDDNSSQACVALLSCTHLFHATCLAALEQFTANDDVTHDITSLTSSSDHSRPHTAGCAKCPVCRSLYTKRLVSAF